MRELIEGTDEITLAKLRALNVEEIVDGGQENNGEGGARIYCGPILDGQFVVETAESTFKAGRQVKILLIKMEKIKKIIIGAFIGLVVSCCLFSNVNAQNEVKMSETLSSKQQSIIPIAAFTANGNLEQLKPAINAGLDAGLTINEIKEVMVHLYAYCGFPRSLRGLQTFMEVVDERKSKGINDKLGADASPVNDEKSKYERGKANLEELIG